ncbi:hypothetical protein MBLNU457_7193t1 [Dothideomycetes sp. NU457]
MATTQAPNPRDFTSADQAFAYPLPVVRKLEQQLRSSIADNKDKLRSLVGASYRDVLSTADKIVDMNSEMQRLEGLLGGIGQRCNAGAIERVAANQRMLSGSRREDVGAKRKVAAEVALLQRVVGVAGRMVRRGEGVLVGAKLLVLARLLHGSLGKGGEEVAVLESLRGNVAVLRRKLMAVIDRQVADGKVERTTLFDLLTAFSLATSSTPTDVLRHFLSVRQTAMKELIENSAERKQEAIVQTLDLLFTTLEQVQAIFPKRMAGSLAKLKLTPLMQDTDIRAIAELDLDLYERWIADDVRKYTPWPRHDELQMSQAKQMVEPWSSTTAQIVQEGIRNVTVAIYDNGQVVRMREQVIKHLLGSPRKITSLDKEGMLESFRSVFMSRLETIMESKSKTVSSIVTEALEEKQASSRPLSLWGSSMADFDLGRGAHKFRSEIVARSLGKDQSLQRLTSSLSKWSRSLEDMRKTIKDMRSTSWEEDIDLDEDDDLEAGRYQDVLGKEDPNALSLRLDSTIKTAFEDTLRLLAEATTTEGTDGDGERHIFLFRLTREVARQPNFPSTASAYHTLLEKLHTKIAAHIASQSLQYLRKQPGEDPSIPFNRTPALILWEGTPQLPVQPSPASIRLLHELRKVMQGAGPDLWTRSAVDALKKDIQSKIAASIKSVVIDVAQPVIAPAIEKEADVRETAEDVETNGEGDENADQNTVTAEETADEVEKDEKETHTAATTTEASGEDAALSQRQIATQTLYDVLYLQRLLAVTSAAKNDRNYLQDVVDALKGKSEVETASMDRLHKSSMDYYKRTYLLFAILSPP